MIFEIIDQELIVGERKLNFEEEYRSLKDRKGVDKNQPSLITEIALYLDFEKPYSASSSHFSSLSSLLILSIF